MTTPDSNSEASSSAPEVGVLALQGDFADHERALHQQGLATRRIRRPADLEGLRGLVLPGGESTTMLKLLEIQGLEKPLETKIREGIPTLATCAGLILCAREVRDPEQRSFGVLDIIVARNGYGRQIQSGTVDLQWCREAPAWAAQSGSHGVFIRAPRILDNSPTAGSDCRVLARRDHPVSVGDPVLVLQGSVLGACFHPELENDHPVTRMFAEAVRKGRFEFSDDEPETPSAPIRADAVFGSGTGC